MKALSRHLRTWALAVLAGSLLDSCAPSAPRGLDSPVSQERMEAAVLASQRRDTAAVPQLVVLLGSDDPAVRLVAINSLETITGQTHGYRDYDPEPDRAAAIERWRVWVGEKYGPAAAAGTFSPQGSEQPGPAGGSAR